MKFSILRSRDPHAVSRRTVLRTLGTGIAAAGAGCLGVVDTGVGDERVVWQRSLRADPLLDGGTLYAVGQLTLHAPAPDDGNARRTLECDEETDDDPLRPIRELAAGDERRCVPDYDGLRAVDYDGGRA